MARRNRVLGAQNRQLARVRERLLHEHQRVQNASQSPDIRLLRDLAHAKEVHHLGSTVHLRRVLLDLLLLAVTVVLRLQVHSAVHHGAEIDQLPATVLALHHVLQLQITVHHRRVLLVHEAHRAHQIVHHTPDVLLGNETLLLLQQLQVVEQTHGTVLHQHTRLPAAIRLSLLESVHLGNVRVVLHHT